MPAAVRTANAQIALAQAQLRVTETDVLADLISSYAEVGRAAEERRIRQANRAALAAQLEEANARFEVGEITRTDVAQVEARLAAADALVAVADAGFDGAVAAIIRLIGQAPSSLSPELPALPLPRTLDQAILLGRDGNPGLVLARLGESLALSAAQQVEANWRPSAGISLTTGGQVNQGFDGNEGGSIGITAQVSVPLYTAGIRRSQVREALGNATAARLDAVGVERSVTEGVTRAWRGLEAARAAEAATALQVAAAAIAFEGAQLEQSVGLRTTLDVLIQQQNLLEAELSQKAAERDRITAEANLAALTGLLTADIVENVSIPPAQLTPVPSALPPEVPLVVVSTTLDETTIAASQVPPPAPTPMPVELDGNPMED